MTEVRVCQDCKQRFQIEPTDFAFYEKMSVPPPTWCPECRLIRRMVMMNKRSIYRTKCGLCGDDTISMHRADSLYKTYCNPCWWSDKWDAHSFARNFDFSRLFFSQFHELMKASPWMATANNHPTMENSTYCNNAGHLKDCYLTYFADFSERAFYCDNVEYSKDCFDSFMVDHIEVGYENVNVKKSYRTYFSLDSSECFDIWFGRNLVGCSNCFGCVNLRSKQYHIFNKPYSKEEYALKLKSFDLGTRASLDKIKQEAYAFWLSYPTKFMHGLHNEAVSGDYIDHSKNVRQSFFVGSGENLKHCSMVYMKGGKDSYDYTSWGNVAEQIYECSTVGENASRIKFSDNCWPNCSDIEYSMFCISSKDLFGCVGLRNKQYCIFNKQYTKEEYEKMVPRIKEQMKTMPYQDNLGRTYAYGEFFPPEIAVFAYNEAVVQEYFPETRAGAEARGYPWRETETKNNPVTMPSTALPERIEDVPDKIVNEMIGCAHAGTCNEQCTVAFRIIRQELAFYREHHLALPRLCPNCRHYARIKLRTPMHLWHRQCVCETNVHSHHQTGRCPNEFETSYAPERPDRVYCEACYQVEIA